MDVSSSYSDRCSRLCFTQDVCLQSSSVKISRDFFFYYLICFHHGKFFKNNCRCHVSDNSSYDKRWRNTNLISLKMSHYYFNCTSASPRIPSHTSSSCVVRDGCAFPDCLGKCHGRQIESWRGGNCGGFDIDLPFIPMHIA